MHKMLHIKCDSHSEQHSFGYDSKVCYNFKDLNIYNDKIEILIPIDMINFDLEFAKESISSYAFSNNKYFVGNKICESTKCRSGSYCNDLKPSYLLITEVKLIPLREARKFEEIEFPFHIEKHGKLISLTRLNKKFIYPNFIN